ncbi:MAG: C39 family peptidase [Akkermansiaceae bacterium]
MRVFLCLLIGFGVGGLSAIPNQVLNAVREEESPLDDREVSDILLSSKIWDGDENLPGEWRAEGSVATTDSSYLLASPRFLGLKAILVRALRRDDRLEEIQLTFADAGSYFGYYQGRAPNGFNEKDAQRWHLKNLNAKNQKFLETMKEQQKMLRNELEKIDSRPREIERGRARMLRASFRIYRHEDLTLSLLGDNDRLLRLIISRSNKPPKGWLDPSLASLSPRERLGGLEKAVMNTERGDLSLRGVSIVPQGYRPYCGLNTIVMAGRYLGLHIDEDWLAVAANFQNTGTAAGSNLPSLYQAVAREAGFKMKRSRDYSQSEVRRSLKQGLPVIVWRRWSAERDREHSRVGRSFARGGNKTFSKEMGFLPDERSPLHASVIIGFNENRKELILLESWAGQSHPRRIPVRELSETAYLTFCFTP